MTTAKPGHLSDGPLLLPRKTSEQLSESGKRYEAWRKIKDAPPVNLDWRKK